MHGRPDVVEELHLNYGLQSSRRHPGRAADDVCLSKRRIEDARSTKLSLQVRRDFEYTTLALHELEVFFARAIRYVLSKHDDARVASHLRMQTTVDQIHHRSRIAAELCGLFIIKFFRSWIDVRRVNEFGYGRGLRLWIS